MKLPNKIAELVEGCTWERITIGQSESKTFVLQSDKTNQYLKIQSLAAIECLADEMERLKWLQGKLPVPAILCYEKDVENEYLLISEIRGKDASNKTHISDLSNLMKQLAAGLRMMHEIEIKECPFDERADKKIAEAHRRVKNGLVDLEDVDDCRKEASAEALFKQLISSKPKNEDLVFTHGDYCLPNIIIDKGQFSGFIDLGRAGISDRYQDLALAVRSIIYNYGEEMVQIFLQEYGVEKVDEEKIEFYQLLDEFF
ncbi:hypothetical protein WQ54_00795 [Bacillus sp. SA1-12]|uniref:APH(3') family aminoglycoside O-phosphotransferase n=1 Tax=Bacillus sp. SA1-12 TaxID=1455638 RepID=UPI000625253E|nr:APH(3') family aminoglycoside O-phosphotransferase [Bacillus sp. SA1-12]KKI94109.1 hypothetical protein WQ54_00795 [Bacillus sp. SA1-12]